MIEIDEATGLPVLPEDYRWRVSDKDAVETVTVTHYYLSYPKAREVASGKNLRVILEQSHTIKPTKMRNDKYRWWNREPKQIDRDDLFRWLDIDSQVTKGIHPIAVRDAANAVYNRWSAKQAREKATTELVGIYPPKKLKED